MKRTLSMLLVLCMLLVCVPAMAEEPITLQWYYNNDETSALQNDWLQKEIEEAFNVKLEMIGRPGADQADWYQRELAANQQFDYLESGGFVMSAYNQIVNSELVMALDKEMIAKNMPNLMAYYAKFSDAFGGDIFDWYEIDGKIYSIPYARPGDAKRNVIGIRGDWLEALNMDVPKTLEDFEKMLDAFTYGDPDGNGIDDTYGFTGVNWPEFSMSPIFQAFGFNMGLWYLDDEGVAQFGTMRSEMKLALETLLRWYMAGYFPTAFWGQDWDAFRSQMTSGVAGACVQSFDAFIDEDNGWALADLKLANPDAWFEISPGFTGPNGDYGCLQFNPVTFAGIMFSYKMEDQPEKLEKYMQVFDALLFNKDWLAKATYGPTGVGYYVDDNGNYIQIPSDENLTTPAGHTIIELKEFINDPSYDRDFLAASNPEYVAAANAAFEMATGIYDIASSTGVDRPMRNQYAAAANNILMKYLQAILTGAQPIDDFDRAIEEWYSAGGTELLAEMRSIFSNK